MVQSVAVKRSIGVVLCLLGSGMLAGCGGTSGFEPPTAGGGGTTLGNLIAFNTTKPGPAPTAAALAERPIDCPQVEVLDGTASSRVYAGADQSNSNVKYQFSLGDVVRECSHVGNDLVLKVGVEGRVLIGPAGTPGSFSAPVRIAIRREKDQAAAAAKFYSVPVTVPAGNSEAPFSVVSDPIAVPFTRSQADQDYTVVVGFDAKGTTSIKPAKKARHARG